MGRQGEGGADFVSSGAENMMSDFARALPGAFDLKDAEPLYLRPVVILVRPGNPRHITDFRDRLEPGMKVMAVAVAGQTALWEDVAGRIGDIDLVRSFRKLLLPEAPNSAEARLRWTQQPEIDAWPIWNIWQVSNPDLAQVVQMDEPFRIDRDAGVVIPAREKRCRRPAPSWRLSSRPRAGVFERWGWKTRYESSTAFIDFVQGRVRPAVTQKPNRRRHR